MADQDDQIDENEEVKEDPSQEEAQEELQNEEQQDDSNQELEDGQDDQQDDSEEEELPKETPSRREQLRIQDLLRKYGTPEERQPQPQTQGVDYRTMIDAPDEVYDDLNKATQDYGTKQYQEGLREANKVRFETRLEVDAPKVASKYPQLDKESDSFNPAVADSFNTMYLSAVGYDERSGSVQNPNLRYADYIDAMFQLVDEAASRQVETTRRNVTKQAARTGLRPDGSTAKTLDLNKDPSEMSDAELQAKLKSLGLAPKKR